MKKVLKQLSQEIEKLALDTVILDAEDITALGKTLASLESIEALFQKCEEEKLVSILRIMKEYVESAILGDHANLSVFEASVSQLQDICRKLSKDGDVDEAVSSLLEQLTGGRNKDSETPMETDNVDSPEDGDQRDAQSDPPPKERVAERSVPAPSLVADEDMEIIADFVAESLENLGAIEVELMELEQDPSDLETINSIFRPFHTVKGVSGFLNFNKINRLAHMAENLLDKARNGELLIDGEIVDIILDSVDLLKQMITNVQMSLNTGSPNEGDIDTEALIAKIDYYIGQQEDDGRPPLGAVLVKKGSVSQADVEEALDVQKDVEGEGKRIGEILVGQQKVKTKDVVTALRDQKRFSGATSLQIKVDTGKLDSIVDMVGELAIAQSMLRQNELVKNNSNRKLFQITNQLTLIISSLQNTAMSLRMVPIKNTFQKMLRLVRDLAKKANKEVRLIMTGEDTEIDRNMVEEIYEPMVHMIRNSIDHGLEGSEEREQNNKPAQGTIHLKAYHKGGEVVIEIEDDGRGLNREKIFNKAVASGLVKSGEQLSDNEIDNLIFHPGFSTADKITDISGRGVGTDVVKSRVEKLRGRVEIQSVTDKGTTFFIRLPLTLAIVDGMIIRVADERYIIPTLNVQESFRPMKTDYHTLKGKGEMIKVRENLIPLVRLEHLFKRNGNGFAKSNGHEKVPWERLVVVVENQERKLCLLVDELISQEEIVIKNLGGWLKDVRGIAGSTIMGDGKVGLILDIGEIYSMTSKRDV